MGEGEERKVGGDGQHASAMACRRAPVLSTGHSSSRRFWTSRQSELEIGGRGDTSTPPRDTKFCLEATQGDVRPTESDPKQTTSSYTLERPFVGATIQSTHSSLRAPTAWKACPSRPPQGRPALSSSPPPESPSAQTLDLPPPRRPSLSRRDCSPPCRGRLLRGSWTLRGR